MTKSQLVSNTRFTHAPVCSLCEMNRLTNRRRDRRDTNTLVSTCKA